MIIFVLKEECIKLQLKISCKPNSNQNPTQHAKTIKMAKIDKLIRKLLSNPKDLTWEELIKILSHFGYEEMKTSGSSSRKFVDDENNIISGIHKPHSNKRLKTYQTKLVIEYLKEKGLLNND